MVEPISLSIVCNSPVFAKLRSKFVPSLLQDKPARKTALSEGISPGASNIVQKALSKNYTGLWVGSLV
jgi:hypothetical protein